MQPDDVQFNDSLQERLLAFLEDELSKAEAKRLLLVASRQKIDESLNKIRVYVQDCENQKLAFAQKNLPNYKEESPTDKQVSNRPAHFSSGHRDGLKLSVSGKEYDPSWIVKEKILFIVRNPARYGYPTIKGSKSIVDAIVSEQPEQANNRTLHPTVSSKLSRLIKAGLIIRSSSKSRSSENHFISADWFDSDKQIKAEHKQAVEGLSITLPEDKMHDEGATDAVGVAISAHGDTEKTASDSESLAAQESTSVSAEEDANTDTDEVNPPVYKAKEPNQAVELGVLFSAS